ncbi:MAG: SRPBCC family protein [Sandaracinaceae bacterium]
MSKIEITRHVDAPPSRVWEALADFGGIYKFHPLVERSPLLTEQARGLGAERRCEFVDGHHVCERVIGWDEGRSLQIEVYDGSMPLACAEGTLTVAPASGGADVTFAFGYEPTMGFVGRIMDALVMRRRMTDTLDKILVGLGAHLRTGAGIGRDGAPVAA